MSIDSYHPFLYYMNTSGKPYSTVILVILATCLSATVHRIEYQSAIERDNRLFFCFSFSLIELKKEKEEIVEHMVKLKRDKSVFNFTEY